MNQKTNPQIALMCAVEADAAYDEGKQTDAKTKRIVQRAHHFLAFLEDADA